MGTKLSTSFPNFITAMESIKNGTDLILVFNNKMQIGYMMSLITFNKRIAEITFEVKMINKGEHYFSISTMKGLSVKAVTRSKMITHDLTIEEWSNLISELSHEHISSQRHLAFLEEYAIKTFTKPKTGCLNIFAITLIIIFFGKIFSTIIFH